MSLTVKEDNGNWHASNGDVSLSVIDGGRAFLRRAIKIHNDGKPGEEINWLVGELNGVRVYVNGNRIVMTTQDFNP